ncbi:hypothetical protein [Streptomyces sp. NPDC051109]|uniref:hypothetical protein n=1 Tax=Streptomyces sp. NPDC051109 TaxID=3365642 RepID=UPI0037B0E33C
MRTRRLLTGMALGAAVLAGITAAPAQAAHAAPAGPATTAGGRAMSIGGPIRSCASVSCAPVGQTEYGDDVFWTYSVVNSAGNRWYRVTSPRNGFIYCMNITAPC